jgi:hypothetical protein
MAPRLPRNRKLIPVVAAVILYTVYAYPRYLIGSLGLDNPWTPYGYLYGFGLLFFLLGLWLIRAAGACRPGRGHDRFWFGVLIGGFVFFASLHAVWILAALHLPYRGGP